MFTSNKKKSTYSIKEIILVVLTSGASLIIGFLSFTGMYALWPALSFAGASFVLSVAYEGEIYLQNIRGALDKLFTPNFMKRLLAKAYLAKHIDKVMSGEVDFFNDYIRQCKSVLSSNDETIETNLVQLEQLDDTFAHQLLSEEKNDTTVSVETQQNLQDWFKKNGEDQKHLSAWLRRQDQIVFWLKIFSILSTVFMGLSTSYLLMEAFSVIPFMATLSLPILSILIVPMSTLAAIAYGLLTFNATTDMFASASEHRVIQLLKGIRQDLASPGWGNKLRGSLMILSGLVLGALAIFLTACTMGTWWTVVKESRPLFQWMSKLPVWVMGIINPIITGLSSIVFNIQNSTESMGLLDNWARSEKTLWQRINEKYEHLQKTFGKNENRMQRFNLPRFFLTIVVFPLRVVFFLGHLLSIGVTADRVPGLSKKWAAFINAIVEGTEDLHYFVDHGCGSKETSCCGSKIQDPQVEEQQENEKIKSFLKERFHQAHGHSHDLDLPTKGLKTILYPVYGMAAKWDEYMSRYHEDESKRLTYEQAWDKQWNNPWEYEIHNHTHTHAKKVPTEVVYAENDENGVFGNLFDLPK